MSWLPVLKTWIQLDLDYVILKAPIIDYYKKRLKDVWGAQGMKEWKQKGICAIGQDYQIGENTYSKYEFIQDYLDNFEGLFDMNHGVPCYIWSWIDDQEIAIQDLENLATKYENYQLTKFDEKYKFSSEGSSKFVDTVLEYTL